MKRLTIILTIFILVVSGFSIYGATGTPSNLVVRTDANNYLLVTAVTQTNPVTQGVFASRTLRTDANGSLQVVLTGSVTPTYPQTIPASTCAAPSLGMSGGVTTGIAFTATPSILNCISGTAIQTITSSSITSTIKYLLPDGSAAAPALAFTNNTNTGIYKAATDYVTFAGQGVGVATAHYDSASVLGIRLRSDSQLSWSSVTNVTSSSDVSLSRAAAKLLNSDSSIRITRGTITTDLAVQDNTVTWNNSGVTFTGWKLNVTDTASNAASLLMDLQVSSTSQFAVKKDGTVVADGVAGVSGASCTTVAVTNGIVTGCTP